MLAARQGLSVAAGIRSDCALLWPLAERLFALGPSVRFLRDATRGGLAAVANELCRGRSFGISLREASLPSDPDVAAVLDLLGLDALEVANEGVLVAVVAADAADAAAAALRGHPTGARAAIAGEITADGAGRVVLETRVGGRPAGGFPPGTAAAEDLLSGGSRPLSAQPRRSSSSMPFAASFALDPGRSAPATASTT